MQGAAGTSNGLLCKVDAAWKEVLLKQGGVHAAMRIIKRQQTYYLFFLTQKSVTAKLDEESDRIQREYNCQFAIQTRDVMDYAAIKSQLMERLLKKEIEDLRILYEPGQTQSLKLREESSLAERNG